MSGAEARKAVRLRIEGRVQAVGFRAWAAAEATRRGLDGWVRNRPDGTVEAVLAGPAETVDAMARACRQGPLAARVAGVAVSPEEAPVPPGFRQRPTA